MACGRLESVHVQATRLDGEWHHCAADDGGRTTERQRTRLTGHRRGLGAVRSAIRSGEAAKQRGSSGENATSWRKLGRSATTRFQPGRSGFSNGEGYRAAAEGASFPARKQGACRCVIPALPDDDGPAFRGPSAISSLSLDAAQRAEFAFAGEEDCCQQAENGWHASSGPCRGSDFRSKPLIINALAALAKLFRVLCAESSQVPPPSSSMV
jgi:hypothetical protein